MKAGLTSKSEAAILKWINDVTKLLCDLPRVTFDQSEALANLRDELNKSIKITSKKKHKPTIEMTQDVPRFLDRLDRFETASRRSRLVAK